MARVFLSILAVILGVVVFFNTLAFSLHTGNLVLITVAAIWPLVVITIILIKRKNNHVPK